MYFIRIPFFIKFFYPKAITKIASSEKVIYLTFDDGPIPEITPWVLDQLNQYKAKATFFCIGDNVYRHPEIYNRILEQGHSVGNHTFNHLNGWKTPLIKYLENTRQCSELVKSKLFRPPYGRITRSQYKALNKDFDIVLWHVLSGDFDHAISEENCYNNVIKNTCEGSIIVFHDSLKAKKNLQATLPRILEHFSNEGFQFKAITSD